MKNIDWKTVAVAVVLVVALNKLPQTKALVNA
jgi:hypothetical protein